MAFVTSSGSADSAARTNTFSSLTVKGMYLILFPLDGSVVEYSGRAGFGSAITKALYGRTIYQVSLQGYCPENGQEHKGKE